MKMTKVFILLMLACFSGCAYQVPLVGNFVDASSSVKRDKLPLRLGLFIDAPTKSLVEKKRPNGIGGKASKWVFPVGENLSKMILSASEASFGKVIVVDSMPTLT